MKLPGDNMKSFFSAPLPFLSHKISIKFGDTPRQNRTKRLCGASGRFRPPKVGYGGSPETLWKFYKRDKKAGRCEERSRIVTNGLFFMQQGG